jgi:hypothetical protein
MLQAARFTGAFYHAIGAARARYLFLIIITYKLIAIIFAVLCFMAHC